MLNSANIIFRSRKLVTFTGTMFCCLPVSLYLQFASGSGFLGGNDPDSMFSVFYKQVAREL